MDERFAYRAKGIAPLLDQQGRKQRWLAAQVGVSESHLSRVISGERLISRESAERIAAALDTSLFLLFEFMGESEMASSMMAVPA
jgi:plasmid maintenance system antidote protein VapI